MANIVVRFLYKVKKFKQNKAYEKNCAYYHLYQNMLHVSNPTFEKHMKGIDEIITFTGEVPNFPRVFSRVFVETYELWKKGHNILVAAPDVCCINDCWLFGEFEEMRLFMPADKGARYNQVPIYMIDGPRYFPENMPESIWELGTDMWEVKQKIPRWDRSQIIHNHMFWSQESIDPDTCLWPEYGYQYSAGEANGIELEDAALVHLHGSRGIKQAVTNMRELCSQ